MCRLTLWSVIFLSSHNGQHQKMQHSKTVVYAWRTEWMKGYRFPAWSTSLVHLRPQKTAKRSWVADILLNSLLTMILTTTSLWRLLVVINSQNKQLAQQFPSVLTNLSLFSLFWVTFSAVFLCSQFILFPAARNCFQQKKRSANLCPIICTYMHNISPLLLIIIVKTDKFNYENDLIVMIEIHLLIFSCNNWVKNCLNTVAN